MTSMLDVLEVEQFDVNTELSDEFGLFDRIGSAAQRGRGMDEASGCHSAW